MARYPLEHFAWIDLPATMPNIASHMKRNSQDIWNFVTERLKELHPELTNDDLVCTKGHETEMLTRVEQRLKKSPLEMAALLDEVFRGIEPTSVGLRGSPVRP